MDRMSSLPDDLKVSCLARLSRFHNPTLPFVSKRFRSLLASPAIYTSSSRRRESCLYVCLRFPMDLDNPNPRWFTLCERPNRYNNPEKPRNLLVSIPSPPFPPSRSSALVAVGSSIYIIGGTIDDEPSSRVLILDCGTHKWSEGPSMLMKRDHPAASVLDGKIYVAGGCKDIDSPSWIEVFDAETWNPVSSPCAKACDSDIIVSTGFDGKVYMSGSKGTAYDPNDGTCEPVDWNMRKGWAWFSYCVIDNVLYHYYNREFRWFDTSTRVWRIMKGLEDLGIPSYNLVKLADYGGKMAVLWDTNAAGAKQIMYAEVAIEMSNAGEHLGNVELVSVVLEIPKCYEFVCVLSATV